MRPKKFFIFGRIFLRGVYVSYKVVSQKKVQFIRHCIGVQCVELLSIVSILDLHFLSYSSQSSGKIVLNADATEHERCRFYPMTLNLDLCLLNLEIYIQFYVQLCHYYIETIVKLEITQVELRHLLLDLISSTISRLISDYYVFPASR